MSEETSTAELLFSLTAHIDSNTGSTTGYSAVSASQSIGLFAESGSVAPMFPNNRVGKPIPVMAEGEYYTKQGGKFVKVVFTRDDINRIAELQPRDVPFNYDHKRGVGRDGVKGWLRFNKSPEDKLSFTREVDTSEGKKLMLFATPELGEEAVELVSTGIYRDVSVEVRPWDKFMTGVALTSYPVMRNLQFGEVDTGEQEAETSETVISIPAPEHPPEGSVMGVKGCVNLPECGCPEGTCKAQETAQEQQYSELDTATGEDMDPKEQEASPTSNTPEQVLASMSEADRKAFGKQVLAGMGIDLDQMVKFSEQLEHDRKKVARESAESDVEKALGTSYFGMTEELAEDCVSALVWARENTSLNFGEEGGAPDVQATVTGLLQVIAKNGKRMSALMGDTAGTDTETGEQLFSDVEPEEEDTEETLSQNTIADIVARAKSLM